MSAAQRKTKTLKLRELVDWPPEPGGAYRPGSVSPTAREAIIAESVPLIARSVTFRATFGQDSHSYHYHAETDGIARQVQRLVGENIGRKVATLGDYDVEIELTEDADAR